MLHFLEQLETLLLICWACIAGLAVLLWVTLSAAPEESSSQGISKRFAIGLFIASISMVCMLLF